MSELIERKGAIEAIKKYGKDALSAGRKHIDPVDDIVELCNMSPISTARLVGRAKRRPARKRRNALPGACSSCGMTTRRSRSRQK